MTLTFHRCDVCRNRIQDDLKQAVATGAARFDTDGAYIRVLLCRPCAKPILDLLPTSKLLAEPRAN